MIISETTGVQERALPGVVLRTLEHALLRGDWLGTLDAVEAFEARIDDLMGSELDEDELRREIVVVTTALAPDDGAELDAAVRVTPDIGSLLYQLSSVLGRWRVMHTDVETFLGHLILDHRYEGERSAAAFETMVARHLRYHRQLRRG